MTIPYIGAKVYNDSRRAVFSIYHKRGFDEALRYLENVVKRQLIRPAYVGLKEELYFYNSNFDAFKLTVSADVGDHSDFSGVYRGKASRFDVTTNIDYKKLDDYSPFQKGVDYQIVLMNKEKNQVEDIFDINFPTCEDCGNRLFEVLLVSPHISIGTGDLIFGQSDATVIELCQYDPLYHSKNIVSDTFSGLIDYPTRFENLPDEDEFREVGYGNYRTYDEMIKGEYTNRVLDDVKYFRKAFGRNIVAAGSPEHFMIDKHNDSWETKLYWVNPIVSDYLENTIAENLEDVLQHK